MISFLPFKMVTAEVIKERKKIYDNVKGLLIAIIKEDVCKVA